MGGDGVGHDIVSGEDVVELVLHFAGVEGGTGLVDVLGGGLGGVDVVDCAQGGEGLGGLVCGGLMGGLRLGCGGFREGFEGYSGCWFGFFGWHYGVSKVNCWGKREGRRKSFRNEIF